MSEKHIVHEYIGGGMGDYGGVTSVETIKDSGPAPASSPNSSSNSGGSSESLAKSVCERAAYRSLWSRNVIRKALKL